jgi:hypothetical protein
MIKWYKRRKQLKAAQKALDAIQEQRRCQARKAAFNREPITGSIQVTYDLWSGPHETVDEAIDMELRDLKSDLMRFIEEARAELRQRDGGAE